jgi:hypothetical protein
VVTVPVAVMPPSIDSSRPVEGDVVAVDPGRADLEARQRALDVDVALGAEPAAQVGDPDDEGRPGHRGGYPSSWSNTAGSVQRRPRAPRWAPLPACPCSLARPAATIFMVRSSTISKLASFWSQ